MRKPEEKKPIPNEQIAITSLSKLMPSVFYDKLIEFYKSKAIVTANGSEIPPDELKNLRWMMEKKLYGGSVDGIPISTKALLFVLLQKDITQHDKLNIIRGIDHDYIGGVDDTFNLAFLLRYIPEKLTEASQNIIVRALLRGFKSAMDEVEKSGSNFVNENPDSYLGKIVVVIGKDTNESLITPLIVYAENLRDYNNLLDEFNGDFMSSRENLAPTLTYDKSLKFNAAYTNLIRLTGIKDDCGNYCIYPLEPELHGTSGAVSTYVYDKHKHKPFSRNKSLASKTTTFFRREPLYTSTMNILDNSGFMQ